MTMSDFERNPRFVMELMEPREGLDKRATENAKSDVIIIWSAVCNFTVPRQAVLVRGRGCLVMFRMDVSLLPRPEKITNDWSCSEWMSVFSHDPWLNRGMIHHEKRSRVPPDGVRVYPKTSSLGFISSGLGSKCKSYVFVHMMDRAKDTPHDGSCEGHSSKWFELVFSRARVRTLLQMVWTRVLLSSRFFPFVSLEQIRCWSCENYERSVSAPNGVLVTDCFMTDVPIWTRECLFTKSYEVNLCMVWVHTVLTVISTRHVLTRSIFGKIHPWFNSLKITPKFEERGQLWLW